ncbi:hypothetical protein [Defluviimonas sp. SAOS-178_SWC]
MSGLRTFVATAALTFALVGPSHPGTLSGQELLRLFADCTGRYSALTEHL